MWSFFKKKQPGNITSKPQARIRTNGLEEISQNVALLSHLADCDVALKFWLPVSVELALKELCELEGDSMSVFLRQALATHCYGIYALHILREQHRSPWREPLFSVSGNSYEPKKDPTYWVPELGKNIIPVKIWISSQLKNDLTILAGHVNLKLSQYVREILISRLFGHGTLPRRPNSFSIPDHTAAERWAGDEAVIWRKVTQEEYRESYVGREMDGDEVIGEK
jgi:hypothetical protein